MKRTAVTLFTLLTILIAGLIPSQAHALTPEMQSAVTWLESAQNSTGSWSNTPEAVSTEYLSTATTIEALTAVGLDMETSSTLASATNWLAGQSVDNTAYLALRIENLHMSGLINTPADIMELLNLRMDGFAWGGNKDHSSSPTHTALSISAIKSTGYYGSSMYVSAINVIAGLQNDDGGWGASFETDSNPAITARVIKALTL